MLKIQLQQALMTELNTNTQGVKFVLGKLGQTKNSKFTIETYGTSVGNELGPMFYELVTEEFVPVVVNNFDAVYSFDNQFNRRSYVAKFSFLIDEQKQDPALEAIDAFIEGLIGDTRTVNGFSFFYQPRDLQFVNVLILNDIKFLEFEMGLTISTTEGGLFGSGFTVELKEDAASEFSTLDMVTYLPVRSNSTASFQQTGANSTKSLVQASSWAATMEFYARLNNTGVLQNLIEQLEDSTTPMNQLYNFRVTNPITNKSYTKTVVVTSISLPIQKAEIVRVTITMEEAKSEIL